MFGAGENVKISPKLQEIVDFIASGEHGGCPRDDDECKAGIQKSVQEALDEAGLENPEDQASFASSGVASAAIAVKGDCEKERADAPGEFRVCYSNSFQGLKTEALGMSMYWALDATLISTPEYLKRIAKVIKSGGSEAAETISDIAKLPEFQAYLESIKGNPELYAVCLRLFYQAAAQAEVGRMDQDKRNNVLSGIGDSIKRWGEFRTKLLEDPNTADAAKASIGSAYVNSVDESDPDKYIVDVDYAPASLFDPKALGYGDNVTLPPDVRSALLLLFYRGVMSARAQGLTGWTPAAVADSIVKKIAAEQPPLNDLGNWLAGVLNNVTLAKDGAVEARLDRPAGKVPGKLFRAMNLDPDNLDTRNDLTVALINMWKDEVEGNDIYRKMDAEKKAAASDKIADQLIEAFGKGVYNTSPASKAKLIALTMLTSMGEDGRIATELPPTRLMERFRDRRNTLSFCLRMKRLFKEAIADDIGKTLDKGDVAYQVAARVEYALTYENADKFSRLDLNAFADDPIKFGDPNAIMSSFEDNAEINGFDPNTRELKPITIGYPGTTSVRIPENFKFSATATAGVTGKGGGFGSGSIKTSYRGYDSNDKFHWDFNLDALYAHTPLLSGDPARTLAYKKASAAHEFGFGELVLGGGIKSGQHDFTILGGILSGDIDGSLAARLIYEYAHGEAGKPGSFSIKPVLEGGRILNANTLDTRELEQFSFGAYQMSAALMLEGLMLHGESKTAINANIGYRHAFSSENPSAVNYGLSISSKPKIGDHALSFKAGVLGYNKLNTNKDYMSQIYAKGGYSYPISRAHKIDFTLGVGIDYTFNSPFVLENQIDEGTSFSESDGSISYDRVPSLGNAFSANLMFGVKTKYVSFETGPKILRYTPVKDEPPVNFMWLFSIGGYLNP